jgi:hypothetical protein
MHSVVGEEKMRETGAEYVSFFWSGVCVCVFFTSVLVPFALHLQQFGARRVWN